MCVLKLKVVLRTIQWCLTKITFLYKKINLVFVSSRTSYILSIITLMECLTIANSVKNNRIKTVNTCFRK